MRGHRPSGWHWQCRRFLRQRTRRDDQRPLQGGTHPPARTLAKLEAVEFATLTWVDWFNNCRLLEPIGTSRRPMPRNANTPCWINQPWRRESNETASGKPGTVPSAVRRWPGYASLTVRLSAAPRSRTCSSPKISSSSLAMRSIVEEEGRASTSAMARISFCFSVRRTLMAFSASDR